MSTTPSSWYIRGEGGQPTGPFTAEQLVQSLQVGRLDRNNICWREGMPQWLPMGEVEPFAIALRAPTHDTGGACGTSRPAGPPAIRGNMPPPRHGAGIMLGRYFPAIAGCTAAGVVFLVVLVGAALMRGNAAGNRSAGTNRTAARGETSVLATTGTTRSPTREEAGILATIIRNYASRLREAHGPDKTDVQRREAVATAVEELKTRVDECGTVTFTGNVIEIIQEGPRYARSSSSETRDRWGITMSVPRELEAVVREGTCTFGSKIWVELEKNDALSIQKGDPMTLSGRVSFVKGSVLFGIDSCIDIQVWPNSEDSVVKSFGMGNLGTPNTIVVPISDDVTCSVGRFKSLKVRRYLAD